MAMLMQRGWRAAYRCAASHQRGNNVVVHADSLQTGLGQLDGAAAARHGLVLPPCIQLRSSLPVRPTRSFSTSAGKDRQVAAHYQAELSRVKAAPIAAHGTTPRLRVAVDVDEVLGQFVFALNQFCQHKYNMSHQVSDYWIYEFAKIWNCDQDRSNHIVHEFFKSSQFVDGIPVMPGAAQSLARLAATCDLVVVTSRQHVIQDQTLNWLDTHFPGTFQEVYFGNHWSLEGVSRKKSEICHTIGAGVLIDDNPGYALECASAGIHVLLYDWNSAYPWSKLGAKQHPLISVVRDWTEVEAALQRLAPELHAKAASAGNGSQHGVIQG